MSTAGGRGGQLGTKTMSWLPPSALPHSSLLVLASASQGSTTGIGP